MSTLTAHQLSFDRTLDASVSQVFAALTDREAIAHWFGPSDEFKVTVHAWDCRVGGLYRVEFKTPDGVHICLGEFKDIVPDERVSYTWSWEGQPPMETLVNFTIKAHGGKTHLSMTHGGFPAAEVRAHHEHGWTGSMDRLGRYFD